MKLSIDISPDTVDAIVVKELRSQLEVVRRDKSTHPVDIEDNKRIEAALIEVLKFNLPSTDWDTI